MIPLDVEMDVVSIDVFVHNIRYLNDCEPRRRAHYMKMYEALHGQLLQVRMEDAGIHPGTQQPQGPHPGQQQIPSGIIDPRMTSR